MGVCLLLQLVLQVLQVLSTSLHNTLSAEQTIFPELTVVRCLHSCILEHHICAGNAEKALWERVQNQQACCVLNTASR